MVAPKKDYIGPDPVAWVERLLVVNEGAAFTDVQRSVIRHSLVDLREQLASEIFECRLSSRLKPA